MIGARRNGSGASAIVAIACALVGSSCATSVAPEVKAPKLCDFQLLSMTVVAAPNLNPAADGTARPVQLRIYQLKDDVRLQSADFEQIWSHDVRTLGPDLIGVAELPIYPDSRTEVKMERNPAALHVVGVAIFREPKGRTWYVSLELPPPPGKLPCDACEGPDCDGKQAGATGSPKFSFYLEGSRIDEGSAHAADLPIAGRARVVRLTPGVPPAPSPASSPASSSP